MNKIMLLTILLFFTACNSEKTKTLNNDAYQEAQETTRSFPRATRNPDEVICHNCEAKFKVSSAMHKVENGQEYIECPICHHDYLKKSD